MRKISFRITFWVSLPFTLAFGLTILAIAHFLNGQVMEEKRKVVWQKLELANSELSVSVDSLRSLHGSILRNEQLKALMREQLDGEASPETRQSLSDICGVYRSRNTSLLMSILPVSLGGDILDNIYSKDSFGGLFLGSATVGQIDRSFSYGGLFPSGDPDNDALVYFGSFIDMENYEKLGYLAIKIRAVRFFMDLPKLLGPSFSQIIVSDENGEAVYMSSSAFEAPAPAVMREMASSGGGRLALGNRAYLVYSRMVDAYPKWHVAGFIDYEDMAQETFRTSMLVAGIFLCSVMLLFAVCFFIAKKITNPIVQMDEAMSQMSGGAWPEPLASRTRDEMHSLITGFNSMVASVRKLTEIRIAAEEEKRRIETSMLESRLELLQSQINPHFIHNTLNTMKYLALREKNTELYDTIVSFNNLLRSNISPGGQFATVSEEILCLESYINIQKKRYDDNQLNVCIRIDPEASQALLPRLILQPLVENALFHGILPTYGAGRIDVAILRDDMSLVIAICDNGQGIQKETLDGLLSGTCRNTRGYNKIGLRNVIDRVKLYYPEKSEFHISSQPGFGTLIEFIIPFSDKAPPAGAAEAGGGG
jgi:two-component system sensor histidine kinase YesM